MGEPSVSGLFLTVLEKLSSPLFQKLWAREKEYRKLRTSLFAIQSLIQDAEEKQMEDMTVRDWLGQLKDALYDADDLLDDYMTEALQDHKVRFITPLVFRIKMGYKMKEMRGRLDSIVKRSIDYGLEVSVAKRHVDASRREPTGSFVLESEIYGREEDKEKLMKLLITGTDYERGLSIIPIVGMGGLGKTTLAQLAFNDHRVLKHFELRMWIHVSDQFDLMSLMQKILRSVTSAKLDLLDMDILQGRLFQQLQGHRFLLVLDDVWSEDHDKSARLTNLLSCGRSGSKIIVTTRSEKVASIWGTVEPYHLKGLSDNDCWMVLMQWAIGVERVETGNLVAIGRKIGKKCKGVPLAAKTVGSLLHMKSDENEWLLVKNSEIWNVSQETNRIVPELRLSYKYLPSHLRQCFAYCSIFEKGYEFEKDELIKQWMAHGFIQSCEVSKQMEDAGTEYFNYLVQRSLFEVIEKDDDGNAIRCRMHDLIIGLARSVAGDEYLNVVANNSGYIPTTTHHLSLYLGAKSPILESLSKANNLRTLVFRVSKENIREVPENFFIGLRCLHVLDLSGIGIKSLPSSIGSLKHLRYLNLSRTDIEMLPTSISILLNLQTLNLVGCSSLREFPRYMFKMISLRHLDISGCDLLTHMPAKIGKLSCLQMLPRFIVCEENRRSNIGELKSLNLIGELNIEKLKNLKNTIEAEEANLKCKHRLRKLRLSWDDYNGEANSIEDAEKVMEGLQPHRNLKRLHVEDYGGLKFPSWMMDLLIPNLVEISFINCNRCQQLPPLGRLLFLKVLILKRMDVVEYVHCMQGIFPFPLLEKVSLEEMPNLEKWWKVDEKQVVLTRLTKMTIKECPKLMTLPSCPSLEQLVLQRSSSSVFKAVPDFSFLSFLSIHEFQETCLPIRCLPHLQTLIIDSCPNLVLLQLEEITTLSVIHIEWCSNLFSILNLKSLEKLLLSGCEKLTRNCLTEEELIQGLTPLKNLCIKYCPGIKSLPDGIQHLSALQRLEIAFCPKLESLPEGLQHMTALQSLLIQECPYLLSLPLGFQHTRLQELWIQQCPHLERRCEKYTGKDWHKIAHISSIFINKQELS